MKKIFALLIALMMVLALAACGGNEETPSGGGTTDPGTSTSQPEQQSGSAPAESVESSTPDNTSESSTEYTQAELTSMVGDTIPWFSETMKNDGEISKIYASNIMTNGSKWIEWHIFAVDSNGVCVDDDWAFVYSSKDEAAQFGETKKANDLNTEVRIEGYAVFYKLVGESYAGMTADEVKDSTGKEYTVVFEK